MSSIKSLLPQVFKFTFEIPVRITDINYGGHVGNDSILSIIHEARMQFLTHHGFTELDCGGVGLIMSDVGIEFKKEVFYGDVLEINVAATNFSSIGFDLYYQLLKTDQSIVAAAKTGMICYNYSFKKITQVPTVVKEKLEGSR